MQGRNTTAGPINQKKGWSASGSLFVGGGGTPEAPKGKGVSCQANFLDDPGTYSVQFSVTPNQILLDNSIPVWTLAEILWTVEGNYVRRVVNVVNGMTVTGVGQSVHVVIYDATVQSPTFAGVPYNASCQVTKGGRATYQIAPYIQRPYPYELGSVFPAIDTIDIPQNCGINSIYLPITTSIILAAPPVVLTDADVRIRQVVNASANYLTAYGISEAQTWVPLAPGANKIAIENRLGVPLQCSPVFGIDG